MKRNVWIITIAILALIAIAGVLVYATINLPKATAPDIQSPDVSQNGNQDTGDPITKPLTLYYIAINDAGQSGDKIGCDDSIVPVKTAEVTTDDVIKSTFERLLADKNQYYGQSGLYNALYRSNLVYVSSAVVDDTVTVTLTGNLSLGGECDNPRVQAQLESAAKSAAGVRKAMIMLNDKPLSEALSLQ